MVCEEGKIKGVPMKTVLIERATAFTIIVLIASQSALGESPTADSASSAGQKTTYSPYVGKKTTRLLWGDTHLHTALSTDAAASGNRLGLDAAYRFARGEQVTTSKGLQAKLKAPLDFLVIADHSDGMGYYGLIKQGHPAIVAEEKGRRWSDMLNSGQGGAAAQEFIASFAQGTLPWRTNDPALMNPIWQKNVDAADAFNEPGIFTALIGYEWTSLVRGNNLHRVVIYRDGADKTKDVLPYTMEDSADPENLWRYLQSYEERTGGSVLAIPHNSNLSNGMMFADVDLSGDPLSKDYAIKRQRWEPLMEISQIKGDSETHPLLSPNDEFADFGTWDKGNLDSSEKKTPDMLPKEYARSALKRGLAYEQSLGVNPFEFGVIASTDSHTSLSAVGEDNFFGKNGKYEPNKLRSSETFRGSKETGMMLGWEQVSSGYAAVWAEDNTREAIFDAMRRREVYGSTGSRIAVRFFAGWSFVKDDTNTPDIAQLGYSKGVPMGSTLSADADNKQLGFLVAAQRDPTGANLDRIQIIKGWLDKNGEAQEQVYNVAWSDNSSNGITQRKAKGRRLASDGSLTAVGSTVNPDATYSNSIGTAELAVVWYDPEFKVDQRAFYYARVLEIPTPRWTAYDAVRLGAKVPVESPAIIQERAYTSPIWYKP